MGRILLIRIINISAACILTLIFAYAPIQFEEIFRYIFCAICIGIASIEVHHILADDEFEPKKIECRDCDCVPANQATWFIRFTKYWRWDYKFPKNYPVCYECMMNIMGDGMMGGGGPTSMDILELTPIYPKEQRGYSLKEKKDEKK